MDLHQLSYAYGEPVASGRVRASPEDFVVDEELGFEPEGEGEHLFLHIRKREANTDWVARELVRWANVRPGDVSYAGLKDRHAVTTQWFSIYLPGRENPDPGAFHSEGVEIIGVTRHSRKLRRGALRGNRFRLRVRELTGDRSNLEQRLARVRAEGVPNYFGPQRFGREGNNVARAVAMFAGKWRERDRHKRGVYISAARSHLFNQLLSARVAANSWNRLLPGECVMLQGSGSFFRAEEIDDSLRARLQSWDVHPSGPLWGKGPTPCSGEAAEFELSTLEQEAALKAGLEAEGLKQERRALRLPLSSLEWTFETDSILVLSFQLPAGAYATAVLREIICSDGVD